MRDFHIPGRSPVFATNGMAATSHPLGSAVALEALKDGGNAMDAALAGAMVLGLCEPQMTGIGGDMFVLFSEPGTGKVRALNGSGRAPAALHAADLRASGLKVIPRRHIHSVTVPGAVDALCRLSADWGRLGLERLLAPSIHYAEEGVPLAPRVALDWAGAADIALKGRARDILLPIGTEPAPGTLLCQPHLVPALTEIARKGREGFYEGPVAEDMVASLRAQGGLHTLEDFAETRSTYTEPVRGTYGDYELLEHPPNTHGAAAILILNILKSFDLSKLDPFGAERAHLEAEATKLAYRRRNETVSDADHMTELDSLLSEDHARALAATIDPERAGPGVSDPLEQVHKDTIYITVVDRDGMSVSLIYSIFATFGSGFASDRYGILFHNRGAGFTLDEGHPNEAMGGKRPMHTIIPGMLRRNGRVEMPFGVMGGPYQAAGHARFVTNIADYGLDPQTAIDAPRTFAWDHTLRVERGYSSSVVDALGAMGHRIDVPLPPIGGAQAIRIHDSGVLEGASDPRKDGCALGY